MFACRTAALLCVGCCLGAMSSWAADPAGRKDAWPDGENEPASWQATGPISSDWQPIAAGFKHIGRGTLVDDLVIVEER